MSNVESPVVGVAVIVISIGIHFATMLKSILALITVIILITSSR